MKENDIYYRQESNTGFGFFACGKINAFEKIAILTGEIVTTQESIRRIAEEKVREDDPFQFEDDLYLLLGSDCIYFNHSCDPNAGIRGYNELFAVRDIMPDDEITFDYSTVVGMAPINAIWEMNCACGSSNCRGSIGNITTLPGERIEYFNSVGALPRFISKQLRLPSSCGWVRPTP